jgi:hypothetical protein
MDKLCTVLESLDPQKVLWKMMFYVHWQPLEDKLGMYCGKLCNKIIRVKVLYQVNQFFFYIERIPC